MKNFFLILLFGIFIFTPVFFTYADTPIKILLVPGHDDKIWGAQYGDIKEADMNLALATEIYNILEKDKRFQVYITRDKDGYVKEFADYFSTQRENIVSFKTNAKQEMQNKINNGSFIKKVNVQHNLVNEDTSIVLYGINKWANENKIDVVIHVHFNDYPRATKWTMGKYKGFAIYMPEGQMINSKESSKLAGNIFLQLSKKYITSTYKKESGGLVASQNLIALGSRGTLRENTRAVLIEYGYIYRFGKNSVRNNAYKNMADLTTKGIINYFFEK
jgi:N-acetylmuramoyl-L-alanine amidase